MDADTQRIWELLSALSDAYWSKLNTPGINVLDALRAAEYRPESAEEIAIWNEITAAQNYASLRRYIESHTKSEITDYAAKLFDSLLADATSRWDEWTASEGESGKGHP